MAHPSSPVTLTATPLQALPAIGQHAWNPFLPIPLEDSSPSVAQPYWEPFTPVPLEDFPAIGPLYVNSVQPMPLSVYPAIGQQTWVNDTGNYITPNAGAIFKENAVTGAMTDGEIAATIGIPFKTITLIRQGIPHWRFDNAAILLATKRLGINFDATRGAMASATAKLLRVNRRYNWSGQPAGHTSLRRKAIAVPPAPSQAVWTTGQLFTAIPQASTSMPGSYPQAVAKTWIKTTNGRLYVTLDGRACAPNCYDYVIGATGSTIHAWSTNVHPAQINIYALDSGAEALIGYETLPIA